MQGIEIETIIEAEIEKVFDIVTNKQDYRWRSNVENLICLDNNHFVEYYKGGDSTTFIITKNKRNREYAFDIENKVFDGEWLGKFYPQENGTTKMNLTVFIHIKNPLQRFLSYILKNPKKVQQQYIRDLKEKVYHEISFLTV
ncbi:MAG: hypothetical protein PHN72_00230 [Bacilli bacterium]|nr:hypothetical protein [Bacilli bacterium]